MKQKNLYATQALKGVVSEDDLSNLIMTYEQIPPEVYIMDIATTMGNTFLLSTSGIVFSWGAKGAVLGRQNFNIQEAQKPTQIPTFPNKIVKIAAGTHHVLALDLNGFVYSWGENSFGQLGHDDTNEYKAPKEIEIFKKDPVVQIYAGGDSSYAVTKNGDLYVWGDVKYNGQKLESQFSTRHFGNFSLRTETTNSYSLGKILEQRLENGLWQKQSGIFFQKYIQILQYLAEFIGAAVESKGKEADQSGRIKELTDKLVKMTSEINELQFQAYGQNPQQMNQQLKSLKEDNLLKAIQQQMIVVQADIANKTSQIGVMNEDLGQLGKDLENIKDQLVEISEKENTLFGERGTIDDNIKKVIRQNKGQNTEELDKLQKDQKRIKELLQANDNIKNTLIKRQNESDVVRLKKTDQMASTQNQLKDLKDRLKLFQDMEVERRKTIKTAYLQENKPDLEKFMVKVYYFYKTMQETNINEIAKKSTQIIGLEEMINQSNSKLKYIKQELGAFKVNPNDGSFDILTRILEILTDNLNTRLRLNDYIGGLLLQVSQKNEEYVTNFKKQYEEHERMSNNQILERQKTITDYIQQQKQKLIEKGRDVIDIKAYTKDLLSFNESQDTKAKGRGCIG